MTHIIALYRSEHFSNCKFSFRGTPVEKIVYAEGCKLQTKYFLAEIIPIKQKHYEPPKIIYVKPRHIFKSCNIYLTL